MPSVVRQRLRSNRSHLCHRLARTHDSYLGSQLRTLLMLSTEVISYDSLTQFERRTLAIEYSFAQVRTTSLSASKKTSNSSVKETLSYTQPAHP